MGTNQIYLFVLLLASLSASCTSDCPNPEPHFEQPFRKCAKLYIMLETALLANPENLYQLQTCFFPSSGSEPTYVPVIFKLNKHFYYTCWTSSVLLKSVDPSVLSVLQLQLLNALLATEDFSSGPGFFDDAGLFFNLTVNSTVHDNPYYQIISLLQELTSWVSIFECWIRALSLVHRWWQCVPSAEIFTYTHTTNWTETAYLLTLFKNTLTHSNQQLAALLEHLCAKLLINCKEFDPENISCTTIWYYLACKHIWCLKCKLLVLFVSIYLIFNSSPIFGISLHAAH